MSDSGSRRRPRPRRRRVDVLGAASGSSHGSRRRRMCRRRVLAFPDWCTEDTNSDMSRLDRS